MTTFRSDTEQAYMPPVPAMADGSGLVPARELGEHLARRLLAAAPPADADRGPLLSMLDEAPELFRSLRARVEIVRTKPGCAVVRTTPGADGSNPCELVAGFLQALPRLTYGVSGSLIENTCVRRGGRACLFTLLWDASGQTRRDPVVGQAPPMHTLATPLNPLAPAPPVHMVAPPLTPAAETLFAEASSLEPLSAEALSAETLSAEAPSSDVLSLEALSADGSSLEALHDRPEPESTRPAKTKRRWPPLWKTKDTRTSRPEPEQSVTEPETARSITEPEPSVTEPEPTVEPEQSRTERATIPTPIAEPEPARSITEPEPEPSRPGRKPVRMRRRTRPRAPVWLKRRGWLLVLAVVAGVAGGTYAAKHQVVSYQARSTMVVQSGASAIGPGGAAEASQLAITYATVIPTDTSILQQAAAQLGITEATLASRLTVSVQTGTAVFVIAYKAPTSAEAVAGAAEVARVVGGVGLPSSTIPTGTVSVVDLANTASTSGSMAKYGKELGGILGLIVGLILAMAAERADPRVDTADDLASVVGVPASLVPDDLSPAELSRAIALEPAGANGVTVVPLARSNGALAGALAEQLRAAWPPGTRAAAVDRAPVGVSPPFETDPAADADASGPTVLVVGAGETLRRTASVSGRLQAVHRGPVWAVLVTRRARRKLLAGKG